ncbi:PRTRC system ThiF family protein [Pedobacter sp. MC2016-24]|uniref:PRTRC system ThiF family protein n=1 Tax=Pedobacter sp. MC2016-24 TaxID=2780090 RepID=UPI00187FAA00|nr:PRTRC system ThiF family protein [Pedobacter sp. MC2016-24]MBE9599867.1 PRTRC system ThiF family protein [Pedobacter sp. MC2016-24]
MKTQDKQSVHFVDSYLLNPTNPITVNLIGAGGTGSHMLHALARINFKLLTIGKAGLQVNVFDPDQIEAPNLGRAEFMAHFIGVNKAVSIVAHINRKYGTNWKALPEFYQPFSLCAIPENRSASITICCVDSAKARFEIAEVLNVLSKNSNNYRDNPMYCLDFGNNKYTGQVILSTVKEMRQPESAKFRPVAFLPPVTQEYADLLGIPQEETAAPSCSLMEALDKQSLFINSALANLGGAMIDQMLDYGLLTKRGFFMNLESFRTEPIAV